MDALEKMRLFVAVFPPAELVRKLADAACALGRGLSPKAVTWTRLEQIHLTLNFLGNVQRARLDEVQRAVAQGCNRAGRHLLEARGLGCFPDLARPRIVWAGLEGGAGGLIALKRALDEDLAPIGFPPEKRAFQPHLTFGRIRFLSGNDRRLVASGISQWREADFGPWIVERVDLMRSVLTPAGPEYSHIHSFDLSGPVAA
jgi:2'-5' RNA ligase